MIPVHVLLLLVPVVLLKAFLFWRTCQKGAKGAVKAAASEAVAKAVAYRVLQTGTAKSSTRIIVTGGSGYLGRHVVECLLEGMGDAIHIVVFDLRAPAGSADPRISVVLGDLCQPKHIRQVLKGATLVIHIAGLVELASTPPAQMMRVNYGCTKDLMEACLELDVQGVIYTSSVLAMMPADAAPFRALPEDTPPPEACMSSYGDSKRLAEQVVLRGDGHVLRTLVLRPGGIYGLGDRMIFDQVVAGWPFMGAGDRAVPLVWVRDAARAHVVAAKALLPGAASRPSVSGRAYNLCHDPVTDYFTYRFFSGGAPLPGEAAEPSPWTGMRHTASMPLWVVWVLCAVNAFTVRYLGWTSVSPFLHASNIKTVMREHTYDITQARTVLGWQPTPFREAAHLIMGELKARALQTKAPKAKSE